MSTRNIFLAATGLAALCLPAGPAATTAAAQPARVATEPRVEREAHATATVTVSIDAPSYDALQSLLSDEAHQALADGRYRRAWHFFWRLLVIDPHDTQALRETGRIAHALGAFTHAVEVLERVDRLNGGAADPELHYLRGEALLALGRKAEGWRELARAERELLATAPDRRGQLWLARIAALRGDLARALATYHPLLDHARSEAAATELTILMIDAHILARDWASAERLLRALLREQPDHGRGREQLAWVLDARGERDQALALYAGLAEEWTDHPRRTADYARALERAYEYPAALERYRQAQALGVDDLSADIARLERRLAPELAAGIGRRSDPSGQVDGWQVAASLPVRSSLRLAVTGSGETASGGPSATRQEAYTAAGWAFLTGRRAATVAAGVTVRQSDAGTVVGGSALLRTSPARPFQVHLRADANLPWRESASTIREHGRHDALDARLYVAPGTSRVLLSVGGQARRLGLTPNDDGSAPRALQLLGFAGIDVTLTSDPRRSVRGETFDAELVAPRSLASSTVVSYRHYEMVSDDPFGARLVLIERSGIDELSGTARHVFGQPGLLGAELRGGVGYDRGRAVRLWRAGASLLLAATGTSRLTLDYDVASESRTGLSGRRHAGLLGLHVDL